ncbi:MAG TPA: hypothetical protein VGM82_24630 [Gemmatimonadaceae bacterium]|jgi:hypothetical protein
MSEYSFSIPLSAANAIGALRLDFASRFTNVEDATFAYKVDDGWCHVACSREVAEWLATAFDAAARRTRMRAEVSLACEDANLTVCAAMRRFGVARQPAR